MQTNPTKDKHIEATYQKIMSLPTEQEQNIAALLANSFGQGLDIGQRLKKLSRKKQRKPA